MLGILASEVVSLSIIILSDHIFTLSGLFPLWQRRDQGVTYHVTPPSGRQ